LAKRHSPLSCASGLNKEVKRRGDVVGGIFRKTAAVVRPIGAVLLEQNDGATCRAAIAD
jgi:hypothetical protein